MFKKILITLAAVVVIVLVIASLQPAEYKISRSIVINAPPAKIFKHIADVKLYQAWNPFAKMDPAMSMSYSGPQAGLGASASWDSKKAGSGTMTETASQAPNHVVFRLDFSKPMVSTAVADYTLEAQGKATQVTWTMSGTNNLIAKAFHLFVNMDKMLGGYFDQGLASLKGIAESEK